MSDIQKLRQEMFGDDGTDIPELLDLPSVEAMEEKPKPKNKKSSPKITEDINIPESELPPGVPIENNGHMPESATGITDAQIEKWDKLDTDKNIPGSGHLFHVKPEHLPESTRLTPREIQGFSIAAVQQAVFDISRKESLIEIFIQKYMRYQISNDGQGRKENIILHQLSAEEKNAIRGGMFSDDIGR